MKPKIVVATRVQPSIRSALMQYARVQDLTLSAYLEQVLNEHVASISGGVILASDAGVSSRAVPDTDYVRLQKLEQLVFYYRQQLARSSEVTARKMLAAKMIHEDVIASEEEVIEAIQRIETEHGAVKPAEPQSL